MRFSLFVLAFLISIQIYAQKGLKTILTEHTFIDQNGNKESLLNIIKSQQGKVIYIDFWASWCMPCRKSMPSSKKLHQKFKNTDVVFLYLSLDAHDKAWSKALERLTLKNTGQHWRRARKDASELLKFFYIYSIPHYMIIGKNGQIVNRDAPPPLDPRVARQLKKWLKQKRKL